MKISSRWLSEWVSSGWDTATLAQRLTMAGFEVESIEPAAAAFRGVVVARVLERRQHPDADKLSVCVVDGGGEVLQVVCGAANARAGMTAALARVGAELPDGTRIRKAKLRGVESCGMLCSARELGMGSGQDGILDLPADLEPGRDLREALGLDDMLLEVAVTPNRGDALSVAGIAREIAAISGASLTPPLIQPVAATIRDSLQVELTAPAACPSFAGRILRDIRPDALSPLWIVERLRRAGLRPVSPVVDVTNYVMLELGQPMHAYDLRRLHGSIDVRFASRGEKLELLDGRLVDLQPDVLVIADADAPVGVAGVMGGQKSGIATDTSDVFLEAAFFRPEVVAGRARRFGMQTDASQRFERGVDPGLQVQAIERATQLLMDIAGGKAGPTVVTQDKGHMPKPPVIRLDVARATRLLGVEIPRSEMVSILERLGMRVTGERGALRVETPAHRFDLSIAEDLIEELARLHGYDAIPAAAATTAQLPGPSSERTLRRERVMSLLADRGYQEAITYSFIEPEIQQRFEPDRPALALANPISAELAVMRRSLLPGLALVLCENVRRQADRAKFFEIGTRFVFDGGSLDERMSLAGLAWGSAMPEQWGSAPRAVDFHDLKGDVEAVLALAHAGGSIRFVADDRLSCLHPRRAARVNVAGRDAGWIGELHPEISRHLELKSSPVVFELDYQLSFTAEVPVYNEVSRFPTIRRDLAIIVKEEITLDQIRESVSVSAGSALKELRVFDLYRGAGIEPGRKSVALGLILQETSRTLTDADADTVVAAVVARLKNEQKATIRE